MLFRQSKYNGDVISVCIDESLNYLFYLFTAFHFFFFFIIFIFHIYTYIYIYVHIYFHFVLNIYLNSDLALTLVNWTQHKFLVDGAHLKRPVERIKRIKLLILFPRYICIEITLKHINIHMNTWVWASMQYKITSEKEKKIVKGRKRKRENKWVTWVEPHTVRNSWGHRPGGQPTLNPHFDIGPFPFPNRPLPLTAKFYTQASKVCLLVYLTHRCHVRLSCGFNPKCILRLAPSIPRFEQKKKKNKQKNYRVLFF